jgi:CoA:oxalate CoA-transferase
MVDSVFACLENALSDYTVTGQLQPRQGNIDSALAPFDSFAAVDGWVVIGVGNDRIWQSLATLLDLSDDSRFASNSDRLANYAVLRRILAAWCASQTVDALLGQLHAAGVPSGPIRSMAELAIDPQLEARGMLLRMADTYIVVPGSPIHIAHVERPKIAQRAPRLGEHTAMILERYGL